jgi:transposase
MDWREIPADTAELGSKLLAEDNLYRLLGDRLGGWIRDEDFADLYTTIGGPAISPVILSLVSVFQMLEKLSDRQAAEALVVRIDWKYALHLPLEYTGFSFTNLSHFRNRVLEHQAEYRVFDRLLEELVEIGFIRRRGKQRTDSTHILGMVAQLNRLELVWETLRVALKALKQKDEYWFRQTIPESFWQEHQVKHSDYRMSKAEMKALLQQTGADGWWLLQQLAQSPEVLQELAEVQVLRTVWEQQFEVDEDHHYQGPRKKVSGSQLIESPHDPEVRYCLKRSKVWHGYRGQVSETAEAKGEINFITDIAATNAQKHDATSLPDIQTRLANRGLLPSEQYVDQAYVSTQLLADSADQGICLMGPLPNTPQNGRFGVSDFQFDLEQRTALCPGERTSESGVLSRRSDGTQEYVFFFGKQCLSCPLREDCTSAKDGRTVRYHINRPFLEMRQAEMQTEAFWQAMQARPPVEGTISQLVRQGARKARYRGERKVNLQWVFTGIAVNLKRLWRAWATDYQPSWVAAETS